MAPGIFGFANLSATTGEAASPQRPNIVFIMSDDHATAAMSCYGGKLNTTPNLDRIAKEGMRFDNCFVGNSICTPSRASILTGQYSHINGVKTFTAMDPTLVTFPKLLHQAGYYTGVIGKWHLMKNPTGFDYWSILPGQGKYFGQQGIMARTDYLVNGRTDCLIFLTATKTNGKEGRPFCARTSDGGKTIQFVSWISPEPEGYSIMPSSVRTSKTQLLSAIRRYEQRLGFIETYVSNDDGRTWEFLNKPALTGEHGGNPPSMVRLKDGRIVLTYGHRSEPFGIRARISSDAGKTWGGEIHLRDDGRTWDIGYPRTFVRPDGKLVTIYYFTTAKNREQHIAATIWSPN